MIEFGYKDAWEHFEQKYGRFVERFPNLTTAVNVPMQLQIPLPEISDRVILFLALACIENFMEILLLCGNGYGLGALALLRGMYERAVTAGYLHRKPEETQNFFDYYWVAQRKLTKAVQDVYGENSLPPDKVRETEENFNAIRQRFEVPDCETCRTTRLNHTWSHLDFVSMAKNSGQIGKLIVPGYLLPTQEAHSTMRSMLSRMEETESGKFAFISGAGQDKELRSALMTAHNVVLFVLDLVREHFNISALDGPVQRCMQDFLEIWKPNDPVLGGGC